MYYLFTKEDKCPEHMQPKDDRFPRSNIKDFMPQMEEDQGNDTRNSNDESNSNRTQQQKQQQHQQQLRSEQLAQQNWFHSGDAWSLFMPNGTTKPTDEAACDVVIKSFIEARIAVCEEALFSILPSAHQKLLEKESNLIGVYLSSGIGHKI